MIKKMILFFFPLGVLAQSYAPAPGQQGSTAIHKDSSVFVGWVDQVVVTRGPMDIQSPGMGNASHGVDADAHGMADNQVVSLGDGGSALITLSVPLFNGVGPDFAVFENGFTDHYMELAFVEVSSDGINFFRFESVSETPIQQQLDNFSYSNCGYVHNLAGKYRQYYGTPFDLEELMHQPGLDVNAITHIRLIDVVGCINLLWGSVDSQGNVINDPYPTAFPSGGFDLDAIGLIHTALGGLQPLSTSSVSVYPSPAASTCTIVNAPLSAYLIRDTAGKVVKRGTTVESPTLDVSDLTPGIYFIQFEIVGTSIQLIKK